MKKRDKKKKFDEVLATMLRTPPQPKKAKKPKPKQA
jgi:hypothetical protein